MSLGAYNLLPFLKGWDYHVYTIPLTPLTIQRKQLLRIERPGWLMECKFATDDCYSALRINFKGPGGREWVIEPYAELGYIAGAVQQDPAGWVQMYWRPFPLLTLGFYDVALFSSGYQGNGIPFVPDVYVEGYLRPESTQSSSLITAFADTIEIIDEKIFLESYRKVQGIKEPPLNELIDYLQERTKRK
jgi:hypothetical protein